MGPGAAQPIPPPVVPAGGGCDRSGRWTRHLVGYLLGRSGCPTGSHEFAPVRAERNELTEIDVRAIFRGEISRAVDLGAKSEPALPRPSRSRGRAEPLARQS